MGIESPSIGEIAIAKSVSLLVSGFRGGQQSLHDAFIPTFLTLPQHGHAH